MVSISPHTLINGMVILLTTCDHHWPARYVYWGAYAEEQKSKSATIVYSASDTYANLTLWNGTTPIASMLNLTSLDNMVRLLLCHFALVVRCTYCYVRSLLGACSASPAWPAGLPTSIGVCGDHLAATKSGRWFRGQRRRGRGRAHPLPRIRSAVQLLAQ